MDMIWQHYNDSCRIRCRASRNGHLKGKNVKANVTVTTLIRMSRLRVGTDGKLIMGNELIFNFFHYLCGMHK